MNLLRLNQATSVISRHAASAPAMTHPSTRAACGISTMVPERLSRSEAVACAAHAADSHMLGLRTSCRAHAATSGSIPDAGPSSATGVVIVDHGSRKKESNDMLFEFVELYKQITGAAVVEAAHMEIAEPTIEQAIGKCASQGVSTIIIAPYFLSRGRHIQQDIPQLVADARAKYPELTCIVAEPIGIDPLMAQLISNRVSSAVEALHVPAH